MQDQEYMYSHAAIVSNFRDLLLMRIRENHCYTHREKKSSEYLS